MEYELIKFFNGMFEVTKLVPKPAPTVCNNTLVLGKNMVVISLREREPFCPPFTKMGR